MKQRGNFDDWWTKILKIFYFTFQLDLAVTILLPILRRHMRVSRGEWLLLFHVKLWVRKKDRKLRMKAELGRSFLSIFHNFIRLSNLFQSTGTRNDKWNVSDELMLSYCWADELMLNYCWASAELLNIPSNLTKFSPDLIEMFNFRLQNFRVAVSFDEITDK